MCRIIWGSGRIHHKGTKCTKDAAGYASGVFPSRQKAIGLSTEHDPSSNAVIGQAIEVHRHLGPGLLESAYEECLALELTQNKIASRRQVPLPVTYKGMRLDCAYRMDLVVQDYLIIEIKTVERLLPIHEPQPLTYLELGGHRIGLLLNFNVPLLRDGGVASYGNDTGTLLESCVTRSERQARHRGAAGRGAWRAGPLHPVRETPHRPAVADAPDRGRRRDRFPCRPGSPCG